jgi:hypothetical protein
MLRSVLYNRYTITFGTIALLAIVWNVYVLFNNDGIVVGRVVTSDGTPVENATVVLSEKTLLVNAPLDKAATDADGRFKFSGHGIYHVYLEAYKDGVGRAYQKDYHLYFRGQNLHLPEPLQIKETQ